MRIRDLGAHRPRIGRQAIRNGGAATLLVAAMVVTGCGTPGGSADSGNDTAKDSTKAVKTSGFESLGKVTLRVVSAEGSGGPQTALKALTKSFEAKYPNVTVKLSFRSFDEWNKAARLQLQSANPPDVISGNQGYQMDGTFVKAGLIRPLDDYAKAYGWAARYSPQSLQQFRWTKSGQFGTGQLWGVAQTGQSTGVFYNKAKAEQLGIDPTSLKTFDDFQAALKTARAKLPASEPVIEQGNKEQYIALHMWGMVQGAYTPAQDARDWITHKEGANFDTSGNVEALTVFQNWAKENYFGKLDDFNGRDENTSAIKFSKGTGLFLLGGNWNAATIKDGLGNDAGFMNMPAGASGKTAAIGSTSFPMEISSKSKYADLGAAYIDWITGPSASKELTTTQQVPAILNATSELSGTFGEEIQAGWQGLVKDGGLTFFPDWASPTMLDTIGQNFQEMLSGRKSPKEVASAIQSDWAGYDKQLRG